MDGQIIQWTGPIMEMFSSQQSNPSNQPKLIKKPSETGIKPTEPDFTDIK